MESLGLGVPGVTALVHTLRSHGLDVSDDILTIEEFLSDNIVRKLVNEKIN